MESFTIDGRRIGAGEPVFVIAEIGVNHNGDPDLARKLIDAAAEAGADAAKFQTFSAERLVASDAPTARYQQRNTGETSQHAMLSRLELSRGAHQELQDYCRRRGILFLSSPFDLQAIDFLDEIGVPAYKVPSPEAIDVVYLRHMGSKRRPVILSTGMCDMGEVGTGIAALREGGTEEIAVLHCTSNYPAEPAEINLRVIPALAALTGLPTGYSDHSDGIAVSVAAVALGATVIEKHLTLDRNLPGPDHRASLEPAAFQMLVNGIREVSSALGSSIKRPQPGEANSRVVGRRSVVLARDLPLGERIGAEDLHMLRPAGGLTAGAIPFLIGRRTARALARGTRLSLADLD